MIVYHRQSPPMRPRQARAHSRVRGARTGVPFFSHITLHSALLSRALTVTLQPTVGARSALPTARLPHCLAHTCCAFPLTVGPNFSWASARALGFTLHNAPADRDHRSFSTHAHQHRPPLTVRSFPARAHITRPLPLAQNTGALALQRFPQNKRYLL